MSHGAVGALVECTVSPTVDVTSRGLWSVVAPRPGTAAFTLNTGGGTHLTWAFVTHGCTTLADKERILGIILEHVAGAVGGCVPAR